MVKSVVSRECQNLNLYLFKGRTIGYYSFPIMVRVEFGCTDSRIETVRIQKDHERKRKIYSNKGSVRFGALEFVVRTSSFRVCLRSGAPRQPFEEKDSSPSPCHSPPGCESKSLSVHLTTNSTKTCVLDSPFVFVTFSR